MDRLIYLQVNIIPMLAVILMRINAERTLSYSWRNHALRFMMVLMPVLMLANTAAWIWNGQTGRGARLALWIFNTVYFALMEFLAYLWYLYVYDILHRENGQRGKKVLLPSLPLLLFLVFLLTNPWHHLLFYIDATNHYVRGQLFLIHTLLAVGYVGVASVQALYYCRKERTKERKRECRWLAYFAVLPLAGGLLQVKFYGLELLWPFTAASLLMVYLNVQQEQVTRDSLTGLNNRRRLDQYLEDLTASKKETENCYCLLMDVDHFKRINDTYGHMAGDAVLKQVADQLKKTFGDSKAFLARYGGDEFIVILRGQTEQEVKAEILELKKDIAHNCYVEGMDWNVSVSVGYAKCHEASVKNVEDLVALADARMYEEKKKNR